MCRRMQCKWKSKYEARSINSHFQAMKIAIKVGWNSKNRKKDVLCTVSTMSIISSNSNNSAIKWFNMAIQKINRDKRKRKQSVFFQQIVYAVRCHVVRFSQNVNTTNSGFALFFLPLSLLNCFQLQLCNKFGYMATKRCLRITEIIIKFMWMVNLLRLKHITTSMHTHTHAYMHSLEL